MFILISIFTLLELVLILVLCRYRVEFYIFRDVEELIERMKIKF